ncbi:hypothetical protein [Bauldia sp.]|uniref:hypothetical protein n=1 Tax=Bauldia sp. TaxID=2575872 RepID=UPI003BAD488F
MRRLLVVVLLAVGIIGAWWLADDSQLGERIVTFGNEVVDRATGERPSWGDVADRVGDFATAERELKQTVGGLSGDPDPSNLDGQQSE